MQLVRAFTDAENIVPRVQHHCLGLGFNLIRGFSLYYS